MKKLIMNEDGSSNEIELRMSKLVQVAGFNLT
jgi:hypothetical protein